MKKNRAVTILKNTISNYARQIIEICVFLVLTPYVAHKLGTKYFGLWSLLWSTVGFFALVDFGYSTAVAKYIADARGRGEMSRLGKLTSTFFWLHVAQGCAVLLAAIVFAPFLCSALDIPDEYAYAAKVVFLLLAFRVAQGLPMGMYTGILTGFQRQAWSNGVKTCSRIVYALIVWAVFAHKPSIEALGWINVLTGVLSNIALIIVCKRVLSGIRISPRLFQWSLLREITSFSFYSFIIQVGGLLYTRVDAIIIQRFLELSKVAYYGIAMQTVGKAGLFCRQLTHALSPMLAELKGAGEESNIRAVFLKGGKLSVALATPLLAGLFWLSSPLIVVWMGEEFAPAVVPLKLLIVATFINTVHNTTNGVLTMTGHQRFASMSAIFGQALNLGLTLALVIPFGIPGVALATCVSSAVVCVLFIQSKAGRLYNFPTHRFYIKVVLPSFVPCVLMIGALWLCEKVMPPTHLWRIALLEIVGGCVFAAAFYLLGLNAKERSYYNGRVLKLIGRGK